MTIVADPQASFAMVGKVIRYSIPHVLALLEHLNEGIRVREGDEATDEHGETSAEPESQEAEVHGDA